MACIVGKLEEEQANKNKAGHRDFLEETYNEDNGECWGEDKKEEEAPLHVSY